MERTLKKEMVPGIRFTGEGNAEVCLFAPLAASASLIVNGRKVELSGSGEGYWQLSTSALQLGDRYYFAINEGDPFPDPASLSQPDGVHEASEAIDLKSFKWTDQNWKNPQLADYIIYELHTGCFTEEGDFVSIIPKLDHIRELGITAIEIMPVAQFPGRRNWGYDGVFPFAVQHSYGGAKGLQELVNACHEKGLAIILDVVYNHLGPEGNYLGNFAPYITGKHHTPWGGAMNFDDHHNEGVRNYFISNALMWLRDFHIDALRLDAVHAIRDDSPTHFLLELRRETDRLMRQIWKTVLSYH
jgi:maltooligosyltrehalose trehalohydrolase